MWPSLSWAQEMERETLREKRVVVVGEEGAAGEGASWDGPGAVPGPQQGE